MQFYLKNKLVVAESGKVLGEVRDVEVVWPDLRVLKLALRRSLFGGDLLVSVDAIVKIDGDRIIVRDALVREQARVGVAESQIVKQPVASVMTRENGE
ncbi:MAG: PRC-barrel domain-containing protein [bacterium]